MRDLRRAEFRSRRQVHVSLQPAQLDCSKTILLREVENLEPIPGWTTQCRKTDRESCPCCAQGRGQSACGERGGLNKLTSRYQHFLYPSTSGGPYHSHGRLSLPSAY